MRQPQIADPLAVVFPDHGVFAEAVFVEMSADAGQLRIRLGAVEPVGIVIGAYLGAGVEGGKAVGVLVTPGAQKEPLLSESIGVCEYFPSAAQPTKAGQSTSETAL